MNCLHCGKKLPLLRKFTDGEFCSDQHKAAYSQESDRVALRRLIETPGMPMRSVKASPKLKGFKQTLEERNPAPPLHTEMMPLGSWVVHRGPSVLLGSVAELESMGRELALGYFRGARPRARLWPPATEASPVDELFAPIPPVPAGELACWNAVGLLEREEGPLFAVAPKPPQGLGAIDAVNWQAWNEELTEAERLAEASPAYAGLVDLGKVLGGGVATPSPQLASMLAQQAAQEVEELPVDPAFPRLAYRTSDPEPISALAQTEPSRQRRLRPVAHPMLRPSAAPSRSEPPVAGLVPSSPVTTRVGSRLGKLELTELPTVLGRRPTWPARLELRAAKQGTQGMQGTQRLPVAASVELVAFGQAVGAFHPWVPMLGEPVFSPGPAVPALDVASRGLPGGMDVAIPMHGALGTRTLIDTGAATPVANPPFLEPPGSVPLRIPSLDPPLSSLRVLPVAARNPLASRCPVMAGEVKAIDYDFEFRRLVQVAGPVGCGEPALSQWLDPEWLGQTMVQLGTDGRGAALRPISGHIDPIPATALAPVISFSGAKPVCSVVGGASPVRLMRLPANKLLLLDCARRPKDELTPIDPKGYLILSSARLKIRRDTESGLVRLRRAMPAMPRLPDLGGLPKWGAGAVMVLALGVFLFSGAPKAAGHISPTQPSAWSNLQNAILNRAAVALTDDFRSGLGDWAGREGWGKSWSFDPTGFARTGTLALYSPSIGLTDYRFEFLGQIEKKALSWVVRAADLENYQVVRLELSSNGPLPRGVVVRYPVIGGRKGSVTRTDLPMPVTTDTVYRVAMEIHGSDQTLTVQGQVVDAWTEKRLKRGGVGFFSGSGEHARLRWIGVWHQYDALGRLCAYLAPRQMESSQ